MSGVRRATLTSVLLILGGVSSAFARWYLVWLAQDLGGATSLGFYSAVLAFTTPCFVAGQLGLRTIILTLNTTFPWETYRRIRVAGTLAAILVTFVFLGVRNDIPLLLGLSVLSFKIADSLADLEIARIQFAGDLIKVALIGLQNAVISVVLSAIGALLTGSVVVAVLGSTAASIITFIYSYWTARKYDYSPTTAEPGYRTILRASVPVTSALMLASLLLYIPVLWLTASGDFHAVGVYSGVAYLLTLADLVGSNIAKVLITPFRRTREESGEAGLTRISIRVSAGLIPLAAIASAMVIYWGDDVFRFIYGPEFEVGYFCLSLFAVACCAIVLSFVQSVSLEVRNDYNRVAVAFFLACVAALLSGFGFQAAGIGLVETGAGMAAVGGLVRFAVLAVPARVRARV